MSNPNKILFGKPTKNLALVRDFIESKATSYGFDEKIHKPDNFISG
ncbi:MAG: hypothetical protein R2942_15165 [Ignavibacteria bacterium]